MKKILSLIMLSLFMISSGTLVFAAADSNNSSIFNKYNK